MPWNTPTADEQRLIDEFLADGDYKSIEEWALDSDYFEDPDSPTGWSTDDGPADLVGSIYGAMEACGFLEERL